MQLVLDIVEPQQGIVYVTGYINDALKLGDKFSFLRVYQPAKKRNQQPKMLSSVDILLTVTTIIVAGELLNQIVAQSTVQIGLESDAEAILALLKEHHWHKRTGRYLLPHNETRLITLSGE